MKIAIIDSASRYTVNLGSAIIADLNRNSLGSAVLYFPKRTLFGKASRRKVRLGASDALWSSFLFPSQICHKAKVDKVQVAHIQLEINTFGHPITLALMSLLLLGLRSAKIKIVITLHGVFPRFLLSSGGPNFLGNRYKKVLFLGFFTLFYRTISLFSSSTIVHSRVFKNWLSEYGISSDKIIYIPHGIIANSKIADKERMEAWKRKTDGKRVILCFGVLSPRKGLENLIKAFKIVHKEHPEILLVLAGDEPVYFSGYKNKLKNLVAQLDISNNVLFAGRIPENDIGPLFQTAEIVVLPYSFSVSASGPLTIAFQYSKPIIATNTVFFRSEITNGENGFLVESGNYFSLYSGIIALLSDSDLRERLGRGASLLSLQNSWEKVACITVSLYQRLLR